MNAEDRLKEHILENYKSIREFVISANLPYSTVDGILKRGINNSSVVNVNKICNALQISADELVNGKIVPKDDGNQKEQDVLSYLKIRILSNDNLTIDDAIMTNEDKQILIDALEMSVEMIRRKHRREDLK